MYVHLCERVRVSALCVHVGLCVCTVRTCVCRARAVTVMYRKSVSLPSLGLASPLCTPVAGCTHLTRAASVVFKEILGTQIWD